METTTAVRPAAQSGKGFDLLEEAEPGVGNEMKATVEDLIREHSHE